MKILRFTLAIMAVGCVLGSAASARDFSAEKTGQVARELSSLTDSVDRLTAVLEAQAGAKDQDLLFQKLDLAIAYLNFRSRRIEMLEQDVQQARAAKGQIESTLNIWLQQRDELADTDSVVTSAEDRQRQDEIELRIDLVKRRISRLDDEIVSLENKIYQLQDQIDSVEAFVQKNLAL